MWLDGRSRELRGCLGWFHVSSLRGKKRPFLPWSHWGKFHVTWTMSAGQKRSSEEGLEMSSCSTEITAYSKTKVKTWTETSHVSGKKGTQSSLKSSLGRVDPKVRDVSAAHGQGFQPLHGLSSISANVQLSPCFCFMETKIPLCKALTWELEDTWVYKKQNYKIQPSMFLATQ